MTRKYYWFKNPDFYHLLIQGNLKNNQTIFDIAFQPCFRDTNCPSDWKSKIEYSNFELNLISRKFDIADPNTPLKYHYESILIPISERGQSQTFINVIRNEYKINEWFSFFIEPESKLSYSFEKEETYYKSFNTSKPFTKNLKSI